ncbi:MAG: hypothetical protein A2015_01825 [Spirochaetes bacterium GWF1_31_7]|nr:MAG: hypothetical protein A2Y30_00775 [Spirochaetes bacterium GWE1_32_154]OHD45946.1 MAG: hypothetical protein A2Y29_16620 [Spirochaetes bacterium GWE2_31_10]OHD48111.1 MAG: hypothetical protein A2015_01825 [Spirochaetes bacterium GWF1_31_7]OHD80415.1 MAG: hypothetical protein A2355_13105 [Spirochaetes bacterium RIFOXYB1_FULL_32_8]HBD95813.1 hypothetical protein [Spirochaetia bacterium]
MTYSIRRCTKNDIDKIVNLRLKLWNDAGAFSKPKESELMYEPNFTYIKKALNDNTMVIPVIEDDNAEIIAIGIGVILEKPPINLKNNGKEGYIFNMHTLEKYRGKGLGKLILDDILDFFGTQSVFKVTLNANQEAATFYTRSGFAGNPQYMELRM